jgi:hypothetical protein
MPIDFPSSPTTGQVYTYLGKSWVYNGTGWDAPKALSEIGAVRTFANAAARSTAIPTPTEGIVTYLNDVNRLDVHNGTAFVPTAGMTLVANVPFTTTSIVSADNVFTSQFLNYRVVFQATKVTTAAQPFITMRIGGVSQATLYEFQGYRSTGTTASGVQGRNVSSWGPVWTAGAGERFFLGIDLYNPATTNHTGITYAGFAFESPSFFGSQISGHRRSATSEDGIQIEVAGTMTGTLKIYGLRDE